MRFTWPLVLMLSGCVVKKYDGASNAGSAAPGAVQARQGVDFSGVEARLDSLISATEDHDQRDRLIAAADLARASKRLSPEAQAVNLDYLQTLLGVEERNVPYAAPTLSGMTVVESAPPPVVEEDPSAPPPPVQAPPPPVEAPPPAAPATPSPAELNARAKELLAADPQGAMAALEPCRDQPCWAEVSETWAEARDAYVFRVREEAGARYIASRQIADKAARKAELDAVMKTLDELLVRYPDSRYADAIRRNQSLVAADLAALDDR